MLVTVAAFREPYEAHLFRGRLAAEGVHAFVAFDQHIGNAWDHSLALGGVKVQVSSDLIELARGVERDCRGGVYKALLQDELGDLDDPICPHCGGTQFRQRRPLPRAVLAIALSFWCGTAIPPLGWIHRCEDCGREYRGTRRSLSKEKCAAALATAVVEVLGYIVLRHCLNEIFGCISVATCW